MFGKAWRRLWQRPTRRRTIQIEVGYGEALDRLSILELKQCHLTGSKRVQAQEQALALGVTLREALGVLPAELGEYRELIDVNALLWQVEDQLRACEANQSFGDGFVSLARQVYVLNDRRAGVKLKVDRRFDSSFREVKSYVD